MMSPRPCRLPCQFALALAAALAACGPGPKKDTAGGWDPLRGDGFEVVDGTAELLRDAWVSRWYGQESPDSATAQQLGDERAALQVQTPSHLAVALGALFFFAGVIAPLQVRFEWSLRLPRCY